MMYLIPKAIVSIAVIVAADAIKDLLNAVLGSSPFSPKYSTNGRLIMGHNNMAILRTFHPIAIVSLFILKFPNTPVIFFVMLLSEYVLICINF